MDDIEAFIIIYIGQYLSTGFEATDNLSHYINVYPKCKSLNDLMLDHLLILEDINQSEYCILAVISDDEEKFFDRITLELLCTLYQHDYLVTGYAKWAAESLTFTKAHITTIHITLIVMVTSGSRQGSSLVYPFSNTVVSLKTRIFIYPTHLQHLPLNDNYAHILNHREDRNTLAHLTLRILSHCNDNTRYIAAHSLAQLVLQV